MRIPVGTEVEIALNPYSQLVTDPRKEYDGTRQLVKRRKEVPKGKFSFAYYELEGVTGKDGRPYSFHQDELLIV